MGYTPLKSNDMELKAKRIKRPLYCISHLYLNGTYICDMIEDRSRGLKQSMSEEEIAKIKVKSQTAIPTGKYEITLKVQSPKFNQKEYYHKYCNGYLPRLKNVKGFEGILMHCGVNQNSSAGCLILGYNTKVGQVTDTKLAFEKLYPLLLQASDRGEKITIEITE